MCTLDTKFGYWPESVNLKWSLGEIESLPGYQQISSPAVENGWYEAGEVPFRLESTHILRLDARHFDEDGSNFIIALTGMLKGLRLQREGWQHLRRTPVVCDKLCDFSARSSAVEKALDVASRSWMTATPEARKLIFGTLHWHLFSQTYTNDFERFNAQYTALDACHELAKKTLPGFIESKTHADRTRMMCSQLGVPVPDWANAVKHPSTGKQEVPVASCRNALVHEAIFGDQPIGFSASGPCHTMTMELNGLVSRLFLKLIGIDNSYTKSSCQNVSPLSFDMP